MTSQVLAGDARYKWKSLDIPKKGGWGSIGAEAKIKEQAREGWIYFDRSPSPTSDDNVVLTFYRAK
ncbi:conserved hypothetical protein [Segniliparus rotundus DSM 44985]|uniref:DUF4177 domain-containing protein n=1 Tax=Segniliparus rotundus (strain ATCC BAA-972 / CDC 1076 / CIP 108378 / DSM 44985 / JCM 13578) TaxID=640132 RepID=D6ZEB4_SEGRD|nr:hypothetical protein [Segniliparus rotundus]ADG97394.1 conserved hypothetical protein [Segniliparus rotundus DSM 44985]